MTACTIKRRRQMRYRCILFSLWCDAGDAHIFAMATCASGSHHHFMVHVRRLPRCLAVTTITCGRGREVCRAFSYTFAADCTDVCTVMTDGTGGSGDYPVIHTGRRPDRKRFMAAIARHFPGRYV